VIIQHGHRQHNKQRDRSGVELVAQAEPFISETSSDDGEESGEDGAPEPYTTEGKRGQ
jgi:hypothetical protein